MHKNITGTHDTSGREGHHYAYAGRWWRFDAELHWQATVFRDSFRVGSTGGAIPLRNEDVEDATVRQSIESFIDGTEEAGMQRRGSD